MNVSFNRIEQFFRPGVSAPKQKAESPITKIFNEVKANGIVDVNTGATWSVKASKTSQGTTESGMTAQGKFELSQGNAKFDVRVKEIATLNEAIVYHNIAKKDPKLKNDKLADHMPKFIGVLDKNGKTIDIQKELDACGGSIEMLCQNPAFKPAFIVIRDLVNQLESEGKKEMERSADGGVKGIKDFKMVRSSLLGTSYERKLHGQTPKNFAYEIVRRTVFRQSGCSFAFQQGVKTQWYTAVINNIQRVLTIKGTQNVLKQELNKLPPEQLLALRDEVMALRTAMKESDYVFSDASLLFLPSKTKDNKTNSLDIRLIDMSHAMSKSEITHKLIATHEKMANLPSNSPEYKNGLKELDHLNKNLAEFEIMKEGMDNTMIELQVMIADAMHKKKDEGNSYASYLRV